jgi:hypothetical protein
MQHPAGHAIAAHTDSLTETIPAQKHSAVRNIEVHVESQTEAVPAQQSPTVHEIETRVLEKTPVVNVDVTHMQENQQHLAHEKSNTSFHFALQNVSDGIVRAQSDLDVLDNDQIRPVLEQLVATPLMEKSIGSTHSSPSVPETQVVVGNSSEFCPVLQ